MSTTELSKQAYDNPRIVSQLGCNAWEGKVTWSMSKSLWITLMASVGIIGAIETFSYENLLVFLVASAITLCLGHSLGMHRRFIHNSYECPKWLEYLFVYLGTLVGLAGPMGMMYTHDLRDWAQRQKRCHPYFGHKTSFLKDGFWQLHCDVALDHPPLFRPEREVEQDRFYQFMEKTWMWQQLPVALVLFFVVGGIDWVIWGVCLRVTVSVTGHWLIGHFAHNTGHREWHVEGAAVQGFNIKFCGLITMGECWHNNHHAYPNSALLGIHPNQTDPGWWVLLFLEKVGLVWRIKKPEDLPARPELVPINVYEHAERRTAVSLSRCGRVG
jgi:stearoyl-CoA desaturase (delta-9 desaturase)